jgi:two-component system cell cycle sensor histidine kinase/response regulator CckA
MNSTTSWGLFWEMLNWQWMMSPTGTPQKSHLKEIRKASFRAKEVVRQILSFARKTMTALKPLEINTIVKESLKLMRASIPAMVDIQPNIPSEPSMILGDPTEIHQIVINLCTNAAHAMKTSGGVLEVAISEVTLDEKPHLVTKISHLVIL